MERSGMMIHCLAFSEASERSHAGDRSLVVLEL